MNNWNNPICNCGKDAVFPRMMGFWYCQEHLIEFQKERGISLHKDGYVQAKNWIQVI